MNHGNHTFPSISPYAATIHEDPTRGNRLDLYQAREYNKLKRQANRGENKEYLRTNFKTINQMRTTSHGILNARKRLGTVYPQR